MKISRRPQEFFFSTSAPVPLGFPPPPPPPQTWNMETLSPVPETLKGEQNVDKSASIYVGRTRRNEIGQVSVELIDIFIFMCVCVFVLCFVSWQS